MSTADDVQNWYDAVQLYESGDINEAIEKFLEVKKSSRILFDIGCCYLRMNDIERAIENYKIAVEMDSHMAIGFFMIGLGNYLLQDYGSAMSNFEKALQLLRGNRCVDYRQLGLKYQLYSCEILTNQAVLAYTENKIGKAKGLLLQAVGCKAEKKHDRIVESLSLLQTGSPFSPFIPPQAEIFRPPKAAVDNLKKKNYLGKAKVITTENTEEIYACFSGIREQMQAPTKTARPRPKPVDRNKMMDELRQPERKKTLKVTQRPPMKKLPELGHVVDTPPRKSLPSMPATLPPRVPPPFSSKKDNTDMNNNDRPTKTLPPRRSSNPPPPAPPASRLPPRKPIPQLKEDYLLPTEEYQALPANTQEEEEYNALHPIVDSSDEEETYEEIDDVSHKGVSIGRGRFERPQPMETRSAPKVPPPRQSSLSTPISPPPRSISPRPGTSPPPTFSRNNSEDNPTPRERKISNATNLAKPGRAPPPPPGGNMKRQPSEDDPSISAPPRKPLPGPGAIPNRRNSDENSDKFVTAPPRRFYPRQQLASQEIYDVNKEMKNVLKAQSLPYCQVDKFKKKEVKTNEELSTISDNEFCVEIEVQYTFVQKVRLHSKMTLEEIKDAVQSEQVPDDIELCFTDDIGRQQTLSEKKLKVIFDGEKPIKKLFCFPES